LASASQFVELAPVAIQFVEQSDAIGQADVAPHFGVARGNAREIAKAAGGEGENSSLFSRTARSCTSAKTADAADD
jgi:hypothetical protein